MDDVTTAPPTPVRTKGKRRLLGLAGLLLLAAGGVGGYYALRPAAPVVPVIDTAGLDPEVVAAVEKAREEAAARPKSAAAWGRLGMVLFAQDLYAESVAALAEAERLDGRDARWPYYRGLALILTRPEEGIAALKRAVAIQPRSLPLRLRLAEQYLEHDRPDDADPIFRDLAADYPDDPRVLLGRGQILVRRGQWREALAPLTAAAGHPTAQRAARVVLIEAYSCLGEPAAAVAERGRTGGLPADLPWTDPFLDEVKGLRTGLQPRIAQAKQLLREGRFEEALALAESVLRDHPDSAEAQLTLGSMLISAGAVNDAEDAIRKAIRLNPELVDAHLLLAGVLKHRKDYAAAERSYLRAIELKPAIGLAHYQLGDCRLKAGDKPGAVATFRNAVRYSPEMADAHLELAELLLQDGKPEEAITHLDDALRLDEKNERARSLREQARAKLKP